MDFLFGLEFGDLWDDKVNALPSFLQLEHVFLEMAPDLADAPGAHTLRDFSELLWAKLLQPVEEESMLFW